MIQRKREAGSVLKLLAILSVAAAFACSSQHKEESTSTGTGNADASTPVAVSSPQDSASAQDEKKRAYIAAYLKRADDLMAQGKHKEAQQQVLEALNLDGSNEAAQAKLKAVNEVLGQPAETKDIVDQTVRYKQALREKKVAEVRDRLVAAQQHYAQQHYKDALSQLELAELTMNYDPVQTDYGSLPSDVAAFKAQVKGAVETDAAVKEQRDYSEAKNSLIEQEERERRQRGEQVRALMTEAINAFNRQDFESSERLANQVLDLQPNFAKAEELAEDSRNGRNAAWRAALYNARRESFQRWMETVREAQIPWHDLIQFPGRREWDRIKSVRRATDAAAAAAQDSEQVAAIKNQLENQLVTWNFKDQPLRAVVQHIRDTQNVNVLLSKAAGAEKGEENVNFEVTSLKFATALKHMLEPLGLVYTFRYDMLYIAKSDETFGNVYPKVYEVRDLTIPLANFTPPKLHLRPGPAGDALANAVFGQEGEATATTSPDQLLDLVKDNVGRGTWEGERSIQLSANQLVAVTTPEVHQQVEKFLEDLRRFTKVIVHVETRFISIREGFLSEIGVDWRGTGGQNPGQIAILDDVTNGNDDNASLGRDNGGLGVPGNASQSPLAGFFFNDRGNQDYRGRTENIFNRSLGNFLSPTGGFTAGVTFLDDIEVSMLIRAVEKSTHANTLTAPRLTIYNNQRSNITIVNQVTYVKDYDVEVAQTAYIADPLVDIVQDGLVLDVRPTVSHDRKYVTLEVQPTIATLNRPIQTFVTPLAGLTTNVIIELPEIKYSSAATTVKVPDNGYLLIGGLKDVTTVDRRSETPILSQIPLLSFFFSKKGRSDEIADLMIILHVKIIDMAEEEANLTR